MNKEVLKKMLFVALIACSALPLFAQEDEKKLSLSGYVQAGYQYDSDISAIENNNRSTFNIKRMRFVAKGEFSSRVSYVGQLEGYSSSKDAEGKALISILDLFLNIKLNSWTTLSVGQFPLPITIDTHDIAPGYLETPDISLIGAKMACRNAITGNNGYGRDTGVKLSGDFGSTNGSRKPFSYIFAVTNGSQTNKLDDNNSKDVTARLMYRPTENITLATTGRRGEYTVADKTEILYTYSFSAIYDNKKLLIRSEYVKNSGESNSVDEEGFYVTSGYRMGKIMPLFRYDYFSINENSFLHGEGMEEQLSIGVLWSPLNYLRVQAYYINGKYSPNKLSATTYPDGNYNRFQLIVNCYF